MTAARMGLRQLRLFLGVAELRSFSGCARAQGITQPALSRVIKALEQELGARLFDRTTRVVTLTPAGRRFRARAEALIRDFEAGFADVKDFMAGAAGEVRIAALPSVAAILLPRAIAEHRQLHPGMAFRVLDGLSSEVCQTVIDGRADIGLVSQPGSTPELDYRELLSDPFGLVCPKAHPLAARETARWADFADQPFVAMALGSGVRAFTDAAFVQIAAPVTPLYECAHLSTAGAIISVGLGISAIPRLCMPLLGQADLAWVPLKSPVLARSLGILTRRNRTLAPCALQFVDLLLAGTA